MTYICIYRVSECIGVEEGKTILTTNTTSKTWGGGGGSSSGGMMSVSGSVGVLSAASGAPQGKGGVVMGVVDSVEGVSNSTSIGGESKRELILKALEARSSSSTTRTTNSSRGGTRRPGK